MMSTRAVPMAEELEAEQEVEEEWEEAGSFQTTQK